MLINIVLLILFIIKTQKKNIQIISTDHQNLKLALGTI